MAFFSQGASTINLPRIGAGGSVTNNYYSASVDVEVSAQGVRVEVMGKVTGQVEIKQGDTSVGVEMALKNPDGTAFSLVGWTTPLFYMGHSDDSVAAVINGAVATIDGDGSTGIIRYAWGSGETDGAGQFLAEASAIDSGGDVRRFPSDGYVKIYIRRAI